jgi:hypothetical protein
VHHAREDEHEKQFADEVDEKELVKRDFDRQKVPQVDEKPGRKLRLIANNVKEVVENVLPRVPMLHFMKVLRVLMEAGRFLRGAVELAAALC